MTRFSNRSALACALTCAALCVGTAVHAQTFPSKPIKLVVPFAAGGATDILARVMAEKMAPRLGQPIVVDNKAGAAGIIGTDAVVKAPPDGYTLLLSISNAMLTNVFLYEKLPYDPRRDLILVSQIATAPLVLVVHPSVTANNGPELLQYVARNKGKLAYGSYGIGSYPHLAGAWMSATQQGDMSHVAYKGEAPMMQDLIGGQIQMAYARVLQAKPYLDAGKIKAIGVTGERRTATLPNIPTLMSRDEGRGVSRDRMAGLRAAGAHAQAHRAALADEAREACEQPDVHASIVAMGFEVKCSSPEAFAASYQQECPCGSG